MASKQEATIPLRSWVDKEKNRVVMVEASGDFVDVLFSFLTLPLGTIIRLVSKNQPDDHDDKPLEIGCINNLYHSVQSFGTDVFWNHICQQMLLSPRNALEASCQRLKLKVDDTEPKKYFMCGSCSKGGALLLSTFAGASCSCGKSMSKEMKLVEESSKEGDAGGNGVFVKGDAMFLIFDDLTVLQSSPSNSIQQLLQLGYKDFSKMTEMSLNVGMKEIFSILKQALTSISPLSDVFLANQESKPTYSFFSPDTGPSYYRCSVKLKITVSKSQKKVLFAEAEGDFVDFLFSFLTTPLGSIMKLSDGKLSLGCIDNLYTSVKNLNSSWLIGSSHNSLLNPGVAHQFSCIKQPLYVDEEYTPRYWYGTVLEKANIRRGMISKEINRVPDPAAMTLFDPRSSDGAKEPAVGFVKRPSLFVVWDDLHVTPVTSASSISLLQKLNVPFDDLAELWVDIRTTSEALNLLGASLTSKVALTESLFYLHEMPKLEMC